MGVHEISDDVDEIGGCLDNLGYRLRQGVEPDDNSPPCLVDATGQLVILAQEIDTQLSTLRPESVLDSIDGTRRSPVVGDQAAHTHVGLPERMEPALSIGPLIEARRTMTRRQQDERFDRLQVGHESCSIQ